MKPIWIIPTAALTLGLALGYGLRKISPPTTPGNTTTAITNPGTRQATRPPALRDSSPRASDSIDACQNRSRTDRIAALTGLYATLDADGFATEAKRLEDVPLDERFLGYFMLYGRWAESDPTAALDHLSAMGRAGTPFLPVLLQCWANVDPAAAAAFYQANPERFHALREMHGGDAAAHIATEWARNDPEAALAWSRALTGDARDAALGSVCRELADADPDKAWDLSNELTPDRRAELLTAIAVNWGRVDHNGIERRIAALSEFPEETRNNLRVTALLGHSEKMPEAALDKLSALPPGPERDAAISQVVDGSFAQHDAAAAARWVIDHTEENYRNDHLTRIMPEYVRQDAKAARAFAESFPPGDARDWAVYCYALSANRQNKESTEQLSSLTETIADPQVIGMARDELSRKSAKTGH